VTSDFISNERYGPDSNALQSTKFGDADEPSSLGLYWYTTGSPACQGASIHHGRPPPWQIQCPRTVFGPEPQLCYDTVR